MKTLIIVMISFFGLSFISNIYAQKTIELGVVRAKSTYLLGEVVDIGIIVKNTSGNPLPVNANIYVTGKVFDSMGSAVKYIGPSGDTFTPSLDELLSKGESFRLIELNQNYGQRRHIIQDNIIGIGKYKINLTLSSSFAETINYEMEFEVVEPDGKEKLVFESYNQAFVDLFNQKYDSQSFVLCLESLFNDHKNIIYAPQILNSVRLWYAYQIKDEKKAMDLTKCLVQDYPWSAKSCGLLDIVLDKKPSSIERIEFLSNLKLKSQGSPMGMIIEIKLFQEINK